MLSSQVRPAPDAAQSRSGDPLPLEFCLQASLLFRHRGRLGLGPGGFPVLLQLVDSWWAAGCRPFAQPDLADRLGLTDRQLRRELDDIERRGLIRREDRRTGRLTQVFLDLSGLFEMLRRLRVDTPARH
jgi:DNA-binding MarR family transcriptional regulator